MGPRRFGKWIVLALTVSCGFTSRSFRADETDNKQKEQDLADVTLALAKREVAAYTMRSVGSDKSELSLNRDSVLRWSNPTAGTVYGEVFLWTSDGRPAVIGSYYRFFAPYSQTVLELQSLSSGQVSAYKGREEVWRPAAQGVKFMRAAGAPNVAPSAVGRINQMRKLARQFSVQVEDRRAADGQVVKRDLRLLSRPIYRYGIDDSQTIDGALFGFVEGTDPEALLLIEGRRHAEQTAWYFAFARMNIDHLVGLYGGNTVWEVERLQAPWNKPAGHYTLFVLEGGE